MANFIHLQMSDAPPREPYSRLITGLAGVAMLSATLSPALAGSGGNAVTVCMNRNPPDGTVITKSVKSSSCGVRCESEIQTPAGQRMLICRGQAIPKGYTLELLTTSPDCACYGRGQNAYMIKAEPVDDEFRQNFPR